MGGVGDGVGSGLVVVVRVGYGAGTGVGRVAMVGMVGCWAGRGLVYGPAVVAAERYGMGVDMGYVWYGWNGGAWCGYGCGIWCFGGCCGEIWCV